MPLLQSALASGSATAPRVSSGFLLVFSATRLLFFAALGRTDTARCGEKTTSFVCLIASCMSLEEIVFFCLMSQREKDREPMCCTTDATKAPSIIVAADENFMGRTDERGSKRRKFASPNMLIVFTV